MCHISLYSNAISKNSIFFKVVKKKKKTQKPYYYLPKARFQGLNRELFLGS